MPRVVRAALIYGVFLIVLYALGSWTLGALGFGSVADHPPAVLFTEQKGIVSVKLQGEDTQAAENGMNLFSGDGMSTGPGAAASLQLFEKSWSRLDQNAELQITESTKAKKQSRLTLTLSKGRLWTGSPSSGSFTGSVLRRIVTADAVYDLPTGADVLMTQNSIFVFTAEGNGVTAHVKSRDDFTVGEGQKWVLPAGAPVPEDPLTLRSALSPTDLVTPFVLDSRRKLGFGHAGTAAGSIEALTLSFPPVGYVLKQMTMTVQGTVSADVRKVLINGHEATIDQAARSFAQEVSPPQGEKKFDLEVKVIDSDGNALAIVNRTVTVAIEAPALQSAPTITAPAAAGGTYRTEAEEVVLRGVAPDGAAGIMVNDYKLQLFDPAKGTWSYLASRRLGNMKPGENIYDVYALDAGGAKSPPARIMIFIGPADTMPANPSSSAPVTSSGPLPNNAPLLPGSLSVIAPTAGTSHAETGTGFLVEGLTSGKTATMWVNDYKLQLYKSGKTTWNYIASVEFANLRRGTNTYVIVARDRDNKILDKMTYTVELK